MSNLGKIFILIGIMWLFQLWFAYKQAKIFQDDIRGLRKQGTMAIGVGGRRYRGGRAFVALTCDENRIVKDGMVLKGFTIFAKSKPLTTYTGFSIDEIASGDRIVQSEKKKVQEAAKSSAQHILEHFERIKTGGE
jgi:DNA-binding transcriptional regulator of glucitol operon